MDIVKIRKHAFCNTLLANLSLEKFLVFGKMLNVSLDSCLFGRWAFGYVCVCEFDASFSWISDDIEAAQRESTAFCGFKIAAVS